MAGGQMRRVMVAVGIVAAVSGGFLVLTRHPGVGSGAHASASTTTTTTTQPMTVPALGAARWSELPASPIPFRQGAAIGWTGRQLLVWGGDSGDSSNALRPDGAAYDPASQQWTMLPAAPISARTGAASVWTGREWIVWGGYDNLDTGTFHVTADGAALDPGSGSWRRLAPGPLSARAGATSVWTGTEMLVLGGYPAIRTNEIRGYSDGAAYDPAHDRWRWLPGLPAVASHQLAENLAAVWTDTSLLVWWPWADVHTSGNTTSGTVGYDLFRYTPADDRWELLPVAVDAPDGISRPIWTGHEVIVPGSYPFRGGFSGPAPGPLQAHRYDPATNRWSPITAGPGRYEQVVWTGRAMLVVDEGTPPPSCPSNHCAPASGTAAITSAWDAATGQWTDLAPSPSGVTNPGSRAAVWTGTELLTLGTVSGTGPAENFGAGEVSRPGPHLLGLRFGT
jgi:hypothetical protein